MKANSGWNSSIVADKLLSGELGVSVYGLGNVGLGVIAVLVRTRVKKIVGVDIDNEKVLMLNRGEIKHPDKLVVEWIKKGLEENRVVFTTDAIRASRDTQVKIIDVPLGLTNNRKPDYTYLDKALRAIAKGLKREDLVVVETTLPPLALEEHVKPVLESESGLKVGVDFYLVYSPERVMIERIIYDIEEAYPKLVGGLDDESLKRAKAFYEVFVRKGVLTEDIRVVELAKIYEAIYRDVNIALANELAVITRRLGVEYERVRMLALTNPYVHLHKPGPGVGGACLPVYPYFLLDRARRENLDLELVSTSRRVNNLQPLRVVSLVREAALKLSLSRAKVLVLGVAYRGGIGDTRNSPSLEIIKGLISEGYEVRVSDPYFKGSMDSIRVENDYNRAIVGVDIVVVATCHPQYKTISTKLLLEASRKDKIAVIDCCNIIELVKSNGKVLYTSIGGPWRSI